MKKNINNISIQEISEEEWKNSRTNETTSQTFHFNSKMLMLSLFSKFYLKYIKIIKRL